MGSKKFNVFCKYGDRPEYEAIVTVDLGVGMRITPVNLNDGVIISVINPGLGIRRSFIEPSANDPDKYTTLYMSPTLTPGGQIVLKFASAIDKIDFKVMVSRRVPRSDVLVIPFDEPRLPSHRRHIRLRVRRRGERPLPR